MKPLPTLRQLRYLVALVEHRHFGVAAETCFVTQSTLSAGLQELESLLGATLIERTRRSVMPTALGLDLAERAQDVLREVEGMVEAAQATRAPLTGALTLGIIPTIGPFLLPKVLPGLRRDYPALRLFLKEDQTARLLEQLADGTLDTAVIALPFPTPNLDSMTIATDHFHVACPTGHPLCRLASVSPDRLPAKELLLLGDGHCLREHALSACRIQAEHSGQSFQATSLTTLVQMVASGLGITLVPEMAVHSEMLRSPDIALRPLSADAPPRDIALLWRKSSGRKAELRLLGDALARHLSNGK